jgi:alkanesulfonate monooxygenase SsuD/methylene tetrahydromethanopterin reductase-like flavin-dependent oxidoreductase (luciferase family)
MGAAGRNFHADLFIRMGYGSAVEEIGRLFRAGRKDDAAAAVPDEMVTDTAIIGSVEQVREQIAAWEKAGVTMLLVHCWEVDQIRAIADAVLAPN